MNIANLSKLRRRTKSIEDMMQQTKGRRERFDVVAEKRRRTCHVKVMISERVSQCSTCLKDVGKTATLYYNAVLSPTFFEQHRHCHNQKCTSQFTVFYYTVSIWTSSINTQTQENQPQSPPDKGQRM